MQRIDQAVADAKQPWRQKIWRTLVANYSKAPFWRSESSWVEGLLHYPDDRLASYNINAIRVICDKLGIAANLTRSSDLSLVDAQGTQLLVCIVREMGGTTYLSGDGADGYQQDNAFMQAGLRLERMYFQHPQYAQGDRPFTPGLSVLDALFWLGCNKVQQLLQPRSAAGSTCA